MADLPDVREGDVWKDNTWSAAKPFQVYDVHRGHHRCQCGARYPHVHVFNTGLPSRQRTIKLTRKFGARRGYQLISRKQPTIEPFPLPVVVAMGQIDGDGRRMSFDAQWPELPWGTRVLVVADPNYRCPACDLYRYPWSETDDSEPVWPGSRMARNCPQCGSDQKPEEKP